MAKKGLFFKLSEEEISKFKTLVMASGVQNQTDFFRQRMFREDDERLSTLRRNFTEIQKQQYINNKLVEGVLYELFKDIDKVKSFYEALMLEAEEIFKND